jgi:hypothetical protein
MKTTIIASLLAISASAAFANGHEHAEETNGPFLNGTFEIYLDGQAAETMDTRFEAFGGYETDITHPLASWVGFGARFDTNYALDRTQDNEITEKQMGLGIGGARLYFGETDAQRMGFAKTSKIGAPVIITKKNSRIDHEEKVVLAFGGWDHKDEFEFNSVRLKREMPYAGVVGWDPETKAMYYGVTGQVNILQASYMQIDTEDGETQRGYAVGAGLHRMGIPIAVGYETWEDKENTRVDYGVMYNFSRELMFTASRVEDDDLGFTYNYLAAVHTKGPVELGLYYHQGKDQVSPWTGRTTTTPDDIKATIKYKF